MACSSAAVIIHPVVNSAVFRSDDRDSRCLPGRGWPGAVDADDDLAPEPGRDLLQGVCQHFPVIGECVRAGVARPEHHGQAPPSP
jgi:hypothetical protein